MRRLIPAFICLVVFAACVSSTEDEPGRDREPTSHKVSRVYAAVGASETAGWGAGNFTTEAWPRVFLDLALPDFRLVNLGLPGATVEDAILRELPRLLRAEPDIVTVWLNANDILQGVTAAQYKQDFNLLLRAIERTGARQILVANTPPLDKLPAYQACRPDPPEDGPFCFLGSSLPAPSEMRAIVDRYNKIIKNAVRKTGTTLIDLHSSAKDAHDRGTNAGLISGDGLHPSTEGHRAVAESFSARLEFP
ncbi:MAG: SGNH/GDSL hydrolase family protein [Actinomycetota bacterium]